MKPGSHDPKASEALTYYYKHTAQIEVVRHDRTLEQIVFPIPELCEYLPVDKKNKIFNEAERDDQGSKVTDFFAKADDMFQEMNWQKRLRDQPALFWVRIHTSLSPRLGGRLNLGGAVWAVKLICTILVEKRCLAFF